MKKKTSIPVENYVHVEELIPRINVKYMLQLAENLEKLEPVESKTAFKNLKRAMVWMEKYIAPTSEFWEWTNDTFLIDERTTLSVHLLGFGWAVAISSREPVAKNEISAEEKRLIRLMNKLTRHIPVKAILRMKSTSWSKTDIRRVVHILRSKGIECTAHRSSIEFGKDSLRIQTQPEERLECTCVSRDRATRIERILTVIKEYADRNHEGAGWCAYQRRRLTVIHKIGVERITRSDQTFLRHPEYGMDGQILASRVKGKDGFSSNLFFVRAKYHLGNIHPRAIITCQSQNEQLKRFTLYLYYLWNFHYSRIWLYLLFEDIYSYANKLSISKQYNDKKIKEYWESLLKADEIMTEMEIHDRIEKGLFQSYAPPHGEFLEEKLPYADPSSVRPIQWLRHHLIEATTTQLYEDPLDRALSILKILDDNLKKTLDLFVATVDIRIQKILHLLQFFFIVGAIAALVQLLNLGELIVAVLDHFGINIPLIAPIPVSLVSLITIVVFSSVTLFLLRTKPVRALIDYLIR